jgi:alkylation response protein AidB-like acyl-CoA dehydrogenase
VSGDAADRDLEAFRARARAWISQQLPGESPARHGGRDIDVQVFRRLTEDDERALIEREARWQQAKTAAGFGLLGWPEEHGGQGMDERYDSSFAALEQEYGAPVGHELVMVTVKLIAPTLRLYGSPRQQREHMRPFMTADNLCCQLFSEPGAGSDLASLGTRARRTEKGWVVSGQKIWSSGANFADYGLLLARTDPDVPKHAGITAFLLPMDAPGLDIRPIRQMSGGSSFAEVYLDDVLVADAMRVGEIGQGWSVALATLGFEREASDGSAGVGGSWEQVRALAETAGAADDPFARQGLARVYTRTRLNELSAESDAVRRAEGADVGATGSLRKLQWVGLLREISDTVSSILQDRLIADTGDPGAFVWNDHVLGSIGYSIAGGTDEVQRNIIGERILRLPPEPRPDQGLPWSAMRR